MIIAQELRLGNLVFVPNLWENQFFKLIEIYSEGCSVSSTIKKEARIVSYQALEPVIVTPSLLQKFGFTMKEYGLHSFVYYIILQQGLHCLYLNSLLQPVKSPAFPVPLTTYRIQYFHQLQNVFFSVTGHELSIFLSSG